jgi:hypothetical protein
VSNVCDREASKHEAAWAPKVLSSHWKKKIAIEGRRGVQV